MNYEVEIIKTHPDAVLPEYKNPGDAGMDLVARLDGSVAVYPGKNIVIPTGIKIHIKDPNLVGIIAGRSGLALKDSVRPGNGIGVIDCNYLGEVGFIACNDGNDVYVIRSGDRVAQILFMPVARVAWKVVDQFSETTERGEGGFGSTGKQ